MSILDELDRAERAMTPGPWAHDGSLSYAHIVGPSDAWLMQFWSKLEEDFVDCEVNASGVALLRNHARALIDIARAAQDYLKGSKRADTEALESALARLEAE